MTLTFDQILTLGGNALGRHDVACPECGPGKRTKANQTRDVLRIWLKEDFASFKCARCEIAGYAFADHWRPAEKSPVRAPAPARDDDTPERQRGKAQWLWSKAISIGSTPAGSYLRTARGIDCHLHSTLRYLRPRKPEHHHALIAPFAMASEPEPGVLHVANADIHGIHLTLLRADGSGKAETEPDKIMIGPSNGWPIILAPPNDSLALGIAEGIETALSMHAQTGIGVWAAGCAGRLPAIADKIPDYVETVTIAAEDDAAGRRGALQLYERLRARGIEVRMTDA